MAKMPDGFAAAEDSAEDIEVLVEARADVADALVDEGLEGSYTMPPEAVATGAMELEGEVLLVSRRFLNLAAAVEDVEVAEVVDVDFTTSSALPTRPELPSNVTRAFSVAHDRELELKRATMFLASSGIL